MSLEDFLLSKRQEPVSPYLSAMTEGDPVTPALQGDVRTDVAIVGAGFTGLAAGLALAIKGRDVRILDAHHVGWGGSGRAWGQVAAFPKFMPARVERDFGPVIGPRLIAAAAQGPDLVFDLVSRYRMQCSETRTGNLIAAHTPGKVAELAATAEDLQRRGYPVRLLNKDETQAAIGSERYSAALFDERGGALNPLGYARGLARAALAEGAQIHGGTPVLELHRRGDGWELYTSCGRVRAETVLLATNAFGDNALFPGLGRAIMPVRAYQLVSEPLDESVLCGILPGRQPLNDTRKLYSGVRVWPDGRLQVGVDGPPFDISGRPVTKSATKRIQMMFPQLKGLRWQYGWGGWVDMAADEYPRIHPLAPNLWAGFGFSGRGIAIATILGRDLAALAEGAPQDVVHPVSPLKTFPLHRVHRPLINALVTYYRLLDAWHDFRFG